MGRGQLNPCLAPAPQGAKHLRRQARQLGPGGSAPDTPSYQGSPTAGPDGRGLSPLKGRSPLVHGGSAAGGEGGSGPAAGEGQQEGEGQLICGVCGIMATSQLNLEVGGALLQLWKKCNTFLT